MGVVIAGTDGTIWTTGHEAYAEGVKNIVSQIDTLDGLRAAGPTVNGTKYFITTGEPGRFVNGKKGEAGFSAYKTDKTVVFVFFSGSSNPAAANVSASGFADYMKNLGF